MKTLMHTYAFLPLVVLYPAVLCDDQSNTIACAPRQYLELGKTGTISCHFHLEFYSVLWYNSTDLNIATPILKYQNHVKTGIGYNSGEFDVHPNGSLVITEVLLKHEKVFSVAYVQTRKSDYVTINVHVIVVVLPSPAYPIVDGCDSQRNCLMEAGFEGNLFCRMEGIRPDVVLQWKTLRDNETSLVSFTDQKLIVTNNRETFDVILVSKYRLNDMSRDSVVLECECEASFEDLHGMATEVDLKFVKEIPTTEAQCPSDTPMVRCSHPLITFLLVFVFLQVEILLILLFGGILKQYLLKLLRLVMGKLTFRTS